jgi:hypothetical protein
MSEVIDDIANFPDKHAFRHDLAADGRESLAHMLMFPELGIAGFIYPTNRATGPGKVRTQLFGPALDGAISEEIEAEIPTGMDFDDWRIGPLIMAVREPHKIVDLEWNGTRIQFKGRFEALHPPYAFSSHPGGNPPYYGDDRTEQHGRLTAEFSVDGVAGKHEGFLIRDHSWGPRIWGLNQHHKWIHATTDECSVHFFEMQSFGYNHLRGFLFKDGEMRHLTAVDYKMRYDDAMMQQEMRTTVVDTDGRSAIIDAQTFAAVKLDSYDPKVYLNEAALKLEIDGKLGTGWAEFCWNRNYMDFAKDYVGRFA